MSARTITVAAISALAIGLVAGPAVAQAAQFEGTVVSKNKQAKRFKLRQDEGGGTFRFKVNRNTTYQDIGGFGGLKVGARNIEVVAHKNAKGRWVATHIEKSGKGGGGGGGGGGGADDGPNHT